MATRESIRDFISDELHPDGRHLNDETDLLGRVLDSMGLLQLVSFLEQEFDIEVLDEDLVAERFRTIDSIAELVESKRRS